MDALKKGESVPADQPTTLYGALAMRLPNPRMVAMDFVYGTLAALPIGAFYFLVVMPATQQSMLLLCISLAVLAFFIGIEVQKRRLGSLGALASTINIIVLDNPMTFEFSRFLDSALGQIVGCILATRNFATLGPL